MQNCLAWDLAGGPTVKTEIPLQGVGGFDPWSGNLKSHMPRGRKSKTQSRSNTIRSSVKTLKMVYLLKTSLNKQTSIKMLAGSESSPGEGVKKLSGVLL